VGYLNAPGKARLRELVQRRTKLIAASLPVPQWITDAIAQGHIRYPGGFK